MKVKFEFDDENMRSKAKDAHDKLYFYLVRAKFALLEIKNAIKNSEKERVNNEICRFEKWFGNLDYIDIVYDNITKILTRFEDEDVILLNDENEPDTFAYIKAGDTELKIYLCTEFWHTSNQRTKEERTKYDSGLGVILHELTHLVCNTEDHFYGIKDCTTNAIFKPRLCVENADSYEYYLEEFRLYHN